MKTLFSADQRATRRLFLKSAFGAAAAPLILPSRVLGRDGQTAPSNRLTFGLIGCGGMGAADAVHIHQNGRAQLLAFADPHKIKRDEFVKTWSGNYAKNAMMGDYKGLKAYADFREILARKDIDGVIVTTPEHWHEMPVLLAAQAGKDIYCEKPLSMRMKEGRRMVDAVRRYGRVLQTGSQQRSSGDFRRAAELVRNGYIGNVNSVYVRVGGPSSECMQPAQPVPEGLDWDMWLGPAPYRPFNSSIHPGGWRSYRDYAGGGTTDWGAHHFDIVQWALGMDESGPVAIVPAGHDNNPALYLRYANGTKVYHVFGDALEKLTWPSPPKGDTNGITFIGDKGWIEVDRGHIRTFPEYLAAQPLAGNDVRLYRSKGHHLDFLDCIWSRQKPICDVEVGCRSASVCHLANIGHWLNRPLRWDPVKENFIGDETACRWLDRPKREAWALT